MQSDNLNKNESVLYFMRRFLIKYINISLQINKYEHEICTELLTDITILSYNETPLLFFSVSIQLQSRENKNPIDSMES